MNNNLKKSSSTKRKLVTMLILCLGIFPVFAWSCIVDKYETVIGYGGAITIHSDIPQVYPGGTAQARNYNGSATITCSGAHDAIISTAFEDNGSLTRWLNSYPGSDRAEAKYTIRITGGGFNQTNIYNFKTMLVDGLRYRKIEQRGTQTYQINVFSGEEDNIVRSNQYYEVPGASPVAHSTFFQVIKDGYTYNSRFAVGAIPRPNYCFEPSSYNVYITSPDESSETRGNREASVNMNFFVRGTAKNPVIEKPFRIGVALRNNNQCHRAVTPNIRFTSATIIEPKYKGADMGVKVSLLDSSNRGVVQNRRYNFGQLLHTQTGAANAKYLNFKIKAEKVGELLPGDFSGSFRFTIEYP